MRNDHSIALKAASAILEPVVMLVATEMLTCASVELCADDCSRCKSDVGSSSPTALDILRDVEGALSGIGPTSIDPIACASSLECIWSAASGVAQQRNTLALGISPKLQSVVLANAVLLRGMRDGMVVFNSKRAENPFQNYESLREDRRFLFEAHARSIPDLKAPEWAVCKPQERRLQQDLEHEETEDQTALSWLIGVQTQRTCASIRDENLTRAVRAQEAAARTWMLLRGEAVGANGSGSCTDCVNTSKKVSCRTHFAFSGRRIRGLRRKMSHDSSKDEYANKALVEAHVSETLERACCARHRNGTKECGRRFCEMHARRQARKRIARTTRRLHERNHSSVHNLSVAAHVGVDILDSSLHPERECRTDGGTATAAECMGLSILHHTSKKYGLDVDSVRKKVEDAGFKLGETLMGVAKATGMFRESKSSGNRRRASYSSKRAEDASVAGDIIRRHREKKRAMEGRLLQEDEEAAEARKYGGYAFDRASRSDLGRHARAVGLTRIMISNATRAMQASMRRVEQRAIRESSSHSEIRLSDARHDHLYWDSVRELAPMDGLLSVQTEQGSVSDRFGGVLAGMVNLKDRYARMSMAVAKRAGERRELSRRKLASRPAVANDLYDLLEKEVSRRRMLSGQVLGTHVVELPESHALSWLHEVVDWNRLSDEMVRLRDVERKRQLLREKGISHDEIAQTHPSGYWHLDNPAYKPGILGDFFRRVQYRKEHGKDPPWHEPGVFSRVRRRLSSDSRHDGRGGLRRLSDAFLEGVVAAPFAFYDRAYPDGQVVDQTKESFFRTALRYIVYGTVGCYLTPPADEISKTQLEESGDSSVSSDGQVLRVHRPSEDKLCFPAFPLMLPSIPGFRETTNTEGVDFHGLEFEEFCARDGVMQNVARFIDSVGLNSTDENPYTGQIGVLRAAEAIDAVNSATLSASASSSFHSAGYLMCSITQAGGLLYVTLLFIITVTLLGLSQCINFVARFGYDFMVAIFISTREDGVRSAAEVPPARRGLARRSIASSVAAARRRRTVSKDATVKSDLKPSFPEAASSSALDTRTAQQRRADNRRRAGVQSEGVVSRLGDSLLGAFSFSSSASQQPPQSYLSVSPDSDEEQSSIRIAIKG